jgi:hypothetical protein
MKKNIDTKKLLFENMGKLNPDFKLNEEDDKWIQKAVDPEHKGYCTPMTKPTCTPKRKALAKRFKRGIENEGVDFNLLAGGDIAKKKAEQIKAKIDEWYNDGEDEAIAAIYDFLMRKGKPFPIPSPEELQEVFDKLHKNAR